MPLAVLSISTTSAAFADTEPFPPTPVPPGSPPPLGAPNLSYTIQFESSGRWPDEMLAVHALCTSFYLRLAALLEEQKGLLSEVSSANHPPTFLGPCMHFSMHPSLSCATGTPPTSAVPSSPLALTS